MNSAATSALAFPVFVQGLALSFGLIVAIGAQNAFVLRQGLRREHVGAVVLFCAAADAVLIAAGVMGMAQALGRSPGLARSSNACRNQVMSPAAIVTPRTRFGSGRRHRRV